MATRIQRKKIAQKQLAIRDKLWPGLDDRRLWLRQQRDGFTTIPRTMPLLLEIMDTMSKGRPVSTTYLELWCRAFDDCFVPLSKPIELAFHAGFTGQRAVSAWRSRIDILSQLGFIDVKPGPNGSHSYALLWNPYLVIKLHHEQKHPGVTPDAYNALVARAVDIGADDLDEPAPQTLTH